MDFGGRHRTELLVIPSAGVHYFRLASIGLGVKLGVKAPSAARAPPLGP
jgi:hypothetical protein